ncbi:hypothetical protein [Croceitalea dokdonensis]|nr:hypothetical protein [Croceitalea dokdonensis]
MVHGFFNTANGFLLLTLSFLVFASGNATAQHKKNREQQKLERKLQRFKLQEKAMADTSFAFYIRRIKAPYVTSSNNSYGILKVGSDQVFMDQIDWVAENSKRVTIHDIGKPTNYRFLKDGDHSHQVLFETKVKGETFQFKVQNSLEQGGQLVITNAKGRSVVYDGKLKL